MPRKKQLHILDGLRGVTAILVVFFHLFQAYYPSIIDNPLHHAFLAVDFFFMMSGYVIGYAYDDRIQKMTLRNFMKVRILRLHPLVILGFSIGLLGYLIDPFVGDQQQIKTVTLIVGSICGFLLIPSMPLPNRQDETFSLNGASWSLCQEYFVSALYAKIGMRLTNNRLIILVGIFSLGTLFVANFYGSMHFGWGWSHFWVAPIRVLFPFFTGLLIFRLNLKVKIGFSLPIISGILIALFLLPTQKMNGLYEAVCIIIIFPLIIIIAVGSNASKITESICMNLGRISYPLYILHYPFINIYTHWVNQHKPSMLFASISMIGLAVFFLFISMIAQKYFDEPIRKKLVSTIDGFKLWLKRLLGSFQENLQKV